MAVGSGQGLSFTGRRVDKRNITCCRIGYKIGCTGDWFMMKISATTSMQLLPAHKHKQMNSSEHCIRCLDCSLHVASAIEISRSWQKQDWQKQDCLKLSHRVMAGVHNAKAEECTIPYTSHRNGMGGLHGNHFAKNSPTKTVSQFPAAISDELTERMAGTRQL